MFYKNINKIEFVVTFALVLGVVSPVMANGIENDSILVEFPIVQTEQEIDEPAIKTKKIVPVPEIKKEKEVVREVNVKEVITPKKEDASVKVELITDVTSDVKEIKIEEEKIEKTVEEVIAPDFDAETQDIFDETLEIKETSQETKNEFDDLFNESIEVPVVEEVVAIKVEENVENVNDIEAIADELSEEEGLSAEVFNDTSEELASEGEELVDGLAMDSDLIENLDNNVFKQMSDIEKHNALLNLQLKRESIKNEIEAIKAKRRMAIDEENEKKEEAKRKQIEWEQAQEELKLEAERKKKEMELQLKKQKEHSILKEYREQALEKDKKWIERIKEVQEKSDKTISEQKALAEDFKTKLDSLNKTAIDRNIAIRKLKKKINEEQKRLEKMEREITSREERLARQVAEANAKDKKGANPFAKKKTLTREERIKLKPIEDLYAVLEVKGTGEDLIAKLISKKGKTFYVKIGTILKSGHEVIQISKTFVRVEYGGLIEDITFPAGGVLDKEPNSGNSTKTNRTTKRSSSNSAVSAKMKSVNTMNDVPEIRDSMLVK